MYRINQDGFIEDPGSRQMLINPQPRVEHEELLHGRKPLRRFIHWFGRLSDGGQLCIWMCISLPLLLLALAILLHLYLH